MAIDDRTANIISKAIHLRFDDLKAKSNELISRKEIITVMRNLYGKKN